MLNVKELFTKMLDHFVGYTEFAVNGYSTGTKTATVETGQTLAASKSGYYPLGVVGYVVSGTLGTYCLVSNVRLTARDVGSATISYSYRIVGTTSTPSLTIAFNILWVKAS